MNTKQLEMLEEEDENDLVEPETQEDKDEDDEYDDDRFFEQDEDEGLNEDEEELDSDNNQLPNEPADDDTL